MSSGGGMKPPGTPLELSGTSFEVLGILLSKEDAKPSISMEINGLASLAQHPPSMRRAIRRKPATPPSRGRAKGLILGSNCVSL